MILQKKKERKKTNKLKLAKKKCLKKTHTYKETEIQKTKDQ